MRTAEQCIAGLMLADNLGDVQDEIPYLCDLLGLPRPVEGDNGMWTYPEWDED